MLTDALSLFVGEVDTILLPLLRIDTLAQPLAVFLADKLAEDVPDAHTLFEGLILVENVRDGEGESVCV